MLRRTLDRIFGAGLGLAALALVAIAALVLVQVTGRVIDRSLIAMGREPVGIAITSLSELGGFLFLGAAFLALAGSLRAGGHVRVTMLVGALPAPLARGVAVLALLGALGLCGFALYSAALQAWDSWSFNAVSFGMGRFPLWVPQAVMVAGLALFALALLDELLALLRGDTPAYQRAEEAKGKIDGH
ncbi:TRAP transporter small permease [Roseovarius autotrophicus]|uniref:TRAP transporter small permease n=1 Tax=Roseovarius autotrophicus TaxID=2824121 RepID=UPI001A0EEB7D|nr:TRAP transporter small permease subunit [Roseovarius autotrophicus]MBE0453684.1 TRAP transporter small permease subunit [Roseovarius sp.]